MNDNKLELGGIFSDGYGIIPKKLMRMKFGDIRIKTNKKNICVKGINIKAVLAYMLSFSGAGNECFPSIETIAKDLEVSRDTVIYAIKAAEELRLINKEQMYPDNPLKHNNKYILDFLNNSTYETRNNRFTTSDGSTFDVVTVEQNNNNINNNNINNNNNCQTDKSVDVSNLDLFEDSSNKQVEEKSKPTRQVKKSGEKKRYFGGQYTWTQCIKRFDEVYENEYGTKLLNWRSQVKSYQELIEIINCTAEEIWDDRETYKWAWAWAMIYDLFQIGKNSKYHKEKKILITPNIIMKNIEAWMKIYRDNIRKNRG